MILNISIFYNVPHSVSNQSFVASLSVEFSFLLKLYFLEQFQVYSKTERKVQRLLLLLLHGAPHSQHCHWDGTCLTQGEPTLVPRDRSQCRAHLRAHSAGGPPVGLDSCVSDRCPSLMPPETPCASPIRLSPTLQRWQLGFFYCLIVLPFPASLYILNKVHRKPKVIRRSAWQLGS